MKPHDWDLSPRSVARARAAAAQGMAAPDIAVSIHALGAPKETAEDLAKIATSFCEYSAAHMINEVPAATIIKCGPVGRIPACGDCESLHRRLSSK